ncbi:hypothetical protein GcM1_068003, partial [Golovinomyces cichoracearum]
MPGKIFTGKHFNKNLPPNTQLATSDNGYSDDELAYKWLWHFHRQTLKHWKSEHCLLIFDSHGSHMTFDFISFCDQLDIIPFCLVAHSTHVCQPLGVTVFSPYKHLHGRSVEDSVRSGKDTFTKASFFQSLHQIRTLTFTRATILSGFKRSGIWPLDRNIVLKALHRRSDPKFGDYLNGGCRYTVYDTTPAIRMPASNEKRSRLPLQQQRMWDKDEEYGALPAKDYQDFMNLLEDHEPSSPLGIENAENEHD